MYACGHANDHLSVRLWLRYALAVCACLLPDLLPASVDDADDEDGITSALRVSVEAMADDGTCDDDQSIPSDPSTAPGHGVCERPSRRP